MKSRISTAVSRWARSFVSMALVASLTGVPAALAQQPANTAADRKKQLNEAFAAVDAALRELPTDSFDPQAVAEKVGRDPAKLFEWVRDNTYYAPYAGALRGSSGVLMDRVGSSLDRALLLADLLRSAGYEVRLAHGTLADPAKVLAAAKPIPANWRDAAAVEAGNADLKAEQESIAALNRSLIERTQRHADLLLKQVQAPVAAAMAAPAEHWWVQVKQGDAWTEADPTLPAAKVGEKLTEAKGNVAAPGDDGKLPAALDAQAHTVDLKVVVERLDNGKLSEVSPLTLTVKPAQLQGGRIVFSHIPVAWKLPSTVPAAERTKALAATAEFIPVFHVNGAANANDAVTDTGVLNTRPDMDRTAGMGKAAGSTLGGLGGGLSGSETAQDSGIWTAEWIELTVRTPGKAPKSIRREVFDLVGPAARAAGKLTAPKVDAALRLDRALALTGETDLLVIGSHASPEYVASRYAASLLKLKRQTLAAMDRPEAKPGVSRSIGFDIRKAAPSPLWGVATARLAASPVAGDVYLDSPNVFALTRRARSAADGKLVTIVRTDLAINDVTARAGVDAFAARVRQGVADTITEEAVARLVADKTIGESASASVTNTANLIEASGPALVLNPAADALAAWPADAQARVRQTVAGGYAVVAATKPSADAKVGWWRVDPATGSTIGVTGDGYHAAATERSQIEAKINGLLDLPFNVTIEEAKAYGQKEFVRMICSGKGLSGVRLLQVFQRANQLYELLVLL